MEETSKKQSWLNRTVLGVGLTSLFSDWSHETATAVLPAFLAAIGTGPVWLGAIEGISDGLSSFTKLAAGHYTDRLKRRKPLAVFGYAFTALATASFWLLVRERPVAKRPQRSFLIGLKALPPSFRRLLVGVGIFGAGDFSHSLLILYATRMLTPAHGMARAASYAVGLYTLHNVFYAGSAYASGCLSDHVPHRKAVLAAGYALAGVTAMLLCTGTNSLSLLAVIFILAGLYIGTEEALEDSLAAETVPKEQHGMAFGTLAAVNAVGDFLSSLLVGFLWSAFNVQTAFSASAVLFFAC